MGKKVSFNPLNGNIGDIAPFELLTHMKTMPGVIVVDKFGFLPETDNGLQHLQVWTLGAETDRYEPDGNLLTYIVGSNNGDTQKIIISGLCIDDDGFWNLCDQVVTLTGQTPVLLPIPMCRGHRIKNLGTVDFLGDLYVYDGSAITGGVPNDLTKVGAHVLTETNVAHNQTLMTQFTIPDGYLGFIRSANFFFANKKDAVAVLAFRAKDYGSVFRTQKVIALNSRGTGALTLSTQGYVGPFYPKTDLHIAVLDTTIDAAGISADYQIYLMELPG